jgi:DTW domain-containing protein YfiP
MSGRGLGRARGRLRCPACAMHEPLCLCAELPRLRVETRVVVWQHAAEAERPSNTARLLALMLEGCALQSFGGPYGAPPRPAPEPGRRAFLLYPAPGAPVLSAGLAHPDPRPLTLVVPDGTWSQARRASRALQAHLPCLALPDGPATRFALRSPRADPRRLSTLEAVARALGIIEGHGTEAALLDAQRRMVERTLFTRGQLAPGDVTGGLDARRHAHAMQGREGPSEPQSAAPASGLEKESG